MKRLSVLAALGLAVTVPAQTLTSVLPRGAAPGAEVDVTFYGRRLADTVGVLAFRPGIEVVSIGSERDDRVRARLRVASDCALGAHPLMLHTKRGLSDVRIFDVAPLPTITEDEEANDLRDEAQVVPLDVTVDGRIQTEDVDWYAVDVRAGEPIVAEVVGVRLGDVEFDPVIELFDATGAPLDSADDSALGRFDPVIRHLPDADGRVLLRLRDVGYGGGSRCFYRLHVGRFPRPSGVVPCGGRPGEEVRVRWLGEVGEELVHLPLEPGNHEWYPRRGDSIAPTPIRLRVTDHAVLVEGGLPEEPVTAPFAWHGVIGTAGEEDVLRFRVREGERIEVEVHARDLRSPLDSVIRLRDEEGKQVAENDDAGGPDGRLRFTAKSEQVLSLAITDQLGRGGQDWFYRVEVGSAPDIPRVREAVPGRRAENLGVAIPRDGRAATMIAVSNLPRGADLRVAFADLPPGVACEIPAFPGGMDSVPVLFRAAADAPLAARALRPELTTTGGEPHAARFDHEVPLIRVRNDRVYTAVTVDGLPVAVTDPVPFAIEVDAPAVPLVQGARLTVPFRIVRAEGFDQDVIVRSLWSPSGVAAGAVRAKAADGVLELPLSARGNAATGSWPLVLTASATVDAVSRTVASVRFDLVVSEPFVTAKVGSVRLEQGQSAELSLELAGEREFEGPLGLEFEGLPRGVKVDLPVVTFAELGQRKLPLEIAVDAPTGRHRSHRILVRVPSPEGPVLHVFDGGEIRIDAPLPPNGQGGMR